ncbi:MAG: glutathione S-transferase family protein [Myxococcales bacterium]|nr:glutathione S-transferase family protein [Myxococcales bacterium]
MYRLYSWEHSYFSGKARAYLRFKEHHDALGPGFEDILATPELLQGLLVPKSGSGAVPQLEAPDGSWVQDSSEIIDFCEAAHPTAPVVPSAETAPRQCLAAYLIELLADEWMVVPGFWERWYFSENGRSLSHRGFNEQQWGAVLAAGAPADVRRNAAAGFFEAAFGISDTRVNPKGVYAGLVHLGVDERTEAAWQASQHRILGLLETHFGTHDYVFGGSPSLADFGLLAPLYAHLYRDAVAGFALRTHFPVVCEWVERTNGEGALNARMYGQKLYSLDDRGELVARPATSDGGEWLKDDRIPKTLEPLLRVFFDEMWPVLTDAARVLTDYIASDAHPPGGELPGKTFIATPGFENAQTGEGALTHAFEIGGVTGRRMVVPYQLWMLQRVERALADCTASISGRAAIEGFLAGFDGGAELLDLASLLAGCRIRKQGARLYSEEA